MPVFGMWYQLLHTAYHEFGHLEDLHFWNAPEGAYGNTIRERMNEELRADAFEDARIAHLAELDRRIFQPQWLGCLSIRLEKHFSGARKWPWGSRTKQYLNHIGYVKSGGQLTTRDVADYFRLTRVKTYKLFEDTVMESNTALIRQAAGDLAYKYVDGAGRRHLMFDFGHLPEIARRLRKRRVRWWEPRVLWNPYTLNGFQQLTLPGLEHLVGSRDSLSTVLGEEE